MEDYERFYDLIEPIVPIIPQVVPKRIIVEQNGCLWDILTGEQCGNVFVHGYIQHTRRSFSRYSRRARFMSNLMDLYEIGEDHVRILQVFDKLLHRWKTTRYLLDRKYFLNIRVLLFLIPAYLGIPHTDTRPLRDKVRFDKQKHIFVHLLS